MRYRRLADKVLSGEKTATSSLYDYSLMNQEEIKVNEYASILDSQGKEKCIVKIERIEIVDFQDNNRRICCQRRRRMFG